MHEDRFTVITFSEGVHYFCLAPKKRRASIRNEPTMLRPRTVGLLSMLNHVHLESC